MRTKLDGSPRPGAPAAPGATDAPAKPAPGAPASDARAARAPDAARPAVRGPAPGLDAPPPRGAARGPLDPAALRDRPRGLDLDGDGARSLFALRLRGRDTQAADERALPFEPILAFEPIRTGAKTIDALLAKLPVQPEIGRIEQALARRRAEGGVPLASLGAMRAKLPPVYGEVMDEVARLTRSFNPVELYTIDDVAAVKKAFLAAAKAGAPLENPRFTYRESTKALRTKLEAEGTKLEAIEARLLELRGRVQAERPRRDDTLARITRLALLDKLDDDLATLQLVHGLEAGDDRRVKGAMAEKYGRGVSRELLDAARMVHGYLVETQAHAKGDEVRKLGAGNLPAELAERLTHEESMTAGEFADAVEWLLARYYRYYEEKTGEPFPDSARFRVEVSDKYSAIDVRDKSSEGPIIGIPDKDRSPKKYLELLRHEVDQHVRQSLNGQLMFGLGGGALKVDEEVWYEGLAKHAEIGFMRERFGDESEPTLPYFVFAIELAERGQSFVEVFEAMRALRLAAGSSEKLAADNAWNATYRAFRGHTDTSNAEAFALPKDQAYLRGWMLQSQLADRGLSHLNEAAIAKLDGLALLARFDFGPDDLLFPDLDLTSQWLDEVLLPTLAARDAERAAREEERAARPEAKRGDTVP